MTNGQKKRAEYFRRAATQIAGEARLNFQNQHFDRTVRQTQEAVELYLKARILELGIEPAKSHDLVDLSNLLPNFDEVDAPDLQFLTEQRILSFYGADDFIPDQEYDGSDAERCLNILLAFKI